MLRAVQQRRALPCHPSQEAVLATLRLCRIETSDDLERCVGDYAPFNFARCLLSTE